MFLPCFRHLIEIEALKKQNNQNLINIANELRRISDLSRRRASAIQKIEDLSAESKKLHLSDTLGNLSLLESRLKKLNLQLSLAATEKEQLAFEHQIQHVKDEIEALETLYFTNLETSESLQLEVETLKGFLDGSLKSLEEITAEVDKNILHEQKCIDNRNLRVEALIALIHPDLKTIYLELEKKFKAKGPISFLIDKKCSECHMQADSTLKNSLEEGRSIETCMTCGRLLIPETAKIY